MTGPAPIPASKPLLLDALGIDFLVYVLGSNSDEIVRWIAGEIELDTIQKVQASRELWSLLQSFHTSDENDDGFQRTFQVANLLSQYVPQFQRSIAGAVRSIAVGDDRPIETGDAITDTLGRIVADFYPIFLLPRPSGLPISMARPNTWGHPAKQEFEAAIRMDPDIMNLYSNDTEESGPSGNVLRSTGSGGTVQLWSLLDSVLQEAWTVEWAATRELPTPAGLLSRTLDQLAKVREAAAGRPAKVLARVGLAGVLLPEGSELDLGWAKLRPMIPSDLEAVPQDIRSELRHVSEDGEELTMSYAGDVLLEMEVDYKVRKIGLDYFMNQEWPDDFNEQAKVGSFVDSTRLALLFLNPLKPPVAMSAWQTIGDPLSPGNHMSFSDLRRRQFVPTRLTGDDVTSWTSNVTAVESRRTNKIDVAIRRAVRASAERDDREDVLVDAVIAWENLVGSTQGEPTLRVSGALAWLLEPSSSREDRDATRKEVNSLYSLRSNIVHGNRPLTATEQATQPDKALEIAVRALKVAFVDRPELLTECKSSDDRSARLLMGG